METNVNKMPIPQPKKYLFPLRVFANHVAHDYKQRFRPPPMSIWDRYQIEMDLLVIFGPEAVKEFNEKQASL